MQLHRRLSSQQGLFHKAKEDADDADEESFVASYLIAKAGKLLTGGLFLKDRVLQVAHILCPERRSDTAPITAAERIHELSSYIYEH